MTILSKKNRIVPINTDLEENIMVTKSKRNLINEREFIIPKFDEYNKILEKNHRVQFLKEICRYYKQRVSGCKPTLEKRIYNYLKLSFFAVKIQRVIRGYNLRTYISLIGRGFKDRNICLNETDFYTLENIKTISSEQFISIEDKKNNVWGFDIMSLYNLLINNPENQNNPYTREPFIPGIFKVIKKFIRLSKILGKTVIFKLDNDDSNLTSQKRLQLRCIEIFHNIDCLGHYSNYRWLFDLQRVPLIKYIKELNDIWDYRAQINNEIKSNICPRGDPFVGIPFNNLHNLKFIDLQKIVFNTIELLVNTGINNDSKNLGAYYVLSALTLVNYKAAEAMPWLYQSVS